MTDNMRKFTVIVEYGPQPDGGSGGEYSFHGVRATHAGQAVDKAIDNMEAMGFDMDSILSADAEEFGSSR